MGSAGTASINDYTGNLVVTHDDVSTAGNLMPVTIQHVYNGYMAGKKFTDMEPYLGHGWRLNIEQTIRSSSLYGLKGSAQTNYPYVYTDGDGTEHYFQYDTDKKLVDEDGLGFELVKTSSGYTVTDKVDNVMTFNTTGNLISIADANKNKMTITYSGNQITKVTDGGGNVITLTEYDNGSNYVDIMTDPSGRVTDFFFDDKGKLIKVLYPDGTSSSYVYDSDEALIKATSAGGQSVSFGYTSSSKAKRISSVTESGSNGAAGQKMTIDYSKYNTSVFRTSGQNDQYGDDDDSFITYQFDNTGKTIAVKEDTADNKALGASKYSYTANSSSKPKSNNKLQTAIPLGRSTNNMASNGNAEDSSVWAASSWIDTCTFTSSYATDQSYYGNRSLKLSVSSLEGDGRARYAQDFSNTKLVPGTTYTLSAYVKTSGITGTEAGKYRACLQANVFDDGETILSTYSEYITGTTDTAINNGWRRLSITFTVPTGATSTRINLAIRKSTGTAWFDGIQVETGTSVNKFNMIENSSMELATSEFSTSWRENNLTTSDVVVKTINRVGDNSFKMVGNAGLNKELVQDIDVKGKEGDSYIISGWASANAVPKNSSDTNKFKISTKITYSDGSEVWKLPAEFNYNISGWQYTAQSFDLDDGTSTVKSPVQISIYLRYYQQANTVYFDDIQLIKDDVAVYTYNDKGDLNLITKRADANEKTVYYDGTSDVKSKTDAKGYVTTYTYDSAHNVTQSVSRTKKTTDYTYMKGLVNSTEIGGLSTSGEIFTISSSSTIDTKGYTTSTTDINGYKDSSTYNELKGVLNTYTDKLGNKTSYTYDADNDLLTLVSTTVKNPVDSSSASATNSYTYDNNSNIKTISRNGTNYTYNYDTYGNNSSVYVGSKALITNQYNTSNGKLLSSTFGNGDVTSYSYNVLDKVSQIKYDGSAKFNFTYDSAGSVTRSEDLINGLQTFFDYDESGRFRRASTIDTTKGTSTDRNIYNIEYGYDVNDNVTSIVDQANGLTMKHKYEYGKDNLLTKYTMPTGRTVTRDYDPINRLKSQTLSTDTPLSMSYVYWLSALGNGNRTTQIKQETIDGVKYSYTYDKSGNITEIDKNDADYLYYTYDSSSELVRVDSVLENITRVYSYDVGGNITSVKTFAYTRGILGTATSTKNYTYGDSNWKDKLTSYNGNSITYDGIGNPLTVGSDTYTWANGRELASSTIGGKTVNYTYGSNGLRVSKTANGVTTNYLYDGDQLVYEQRGDKDIFYYYNADGQVTGIQYNGLNYYFTFNLRGDIIGVYTGAGVLKGSYEYNEWGKLLSVKDSEGNTITDPGNIVLINPIRYRGYYYDSETGMYYLQSRYYNPEWGRFINADNVVDIQNKSNLFAYCANNPISNVDSNGDEWYNGHEWVSSLGGDDNDKKPKSNKKKGTLGIGVSVMAEAGIKGSLSAQVIVDQHSNLGLGISLGGGAGTIGAGASICGSYTNAETIYDLKDLGGEIGGSFNLGPIPVGIGADRIFSSDGKIKGYNINVGPKIEPFFEIHIDATYTKFLPIKPVDPIMPFVPKMF